LKEKRKRNKKEKVKQKAYLKFKHYLNPSWSLFFKNLSLHIYRSQTDQESWPAFPAERLSQLPDPQELTIIVHSLI